MYTFWGKTGYKVDENAGKVYPEYTYKVKPYTKYHKTPGKVYRKGSVDLQKNIDNCKVKILKPCGYAAFVV